MKKLQLPANERERAGGTVPATKSKEAVEVLEREQNVGSLRVVAGNVGMLPVFEPEAAFKGDS
jgi:hypothetical protein